LQMIKDGVYNADPHPGNVIVMPCGRLGLLDYGMVVRLTQDERMNIANTLVALSNNDKKAAARIYNDAGYKSSWKEGAITDPNVLHRFATFHFDRFDLSPVKNNGTMIDMMEILKSTQETSIPMWVEEARRLNGLLLGVAFQAQRPVSLAREWKSIARQAVRDGKK
jgi:aarF domain-containing kinase